MRVSERVKISLFVWLCLSVGARADMILESPLNFEAPSRVCAYTDYYEALIWDKTGLFRSMNMPDLSPSSLFTEGPDLCHPPLVSPVHIAADNGNSSLSLCLSALISLGLYGSIPSIKKLSLGFIPPWYHCGGPYQIGHSIAVNPDLATRGSVCCFIQPACTGNNYLPPYGYGIVLSLWLQSQFMPNVRVSRGPPFRSC